MFSLLPYGWRDCGNIDKTFCQCLKIKAGSTDDYWTHPIGLQALKASCDIPQPMTHRILGSKGDMTVQKVLCAGQVLIVRPCRQDAPPIINLQSIGIHNRPVETLCQFQGQTGFAGSRRTDDGDGVQLTTFPRR